MLLMDQYNRWTWIFIIIQSFTHHHHADSIPIETKYCGIKLHSKRKFRIKI